jgi:hypothetical protein
MKGRHMEKKRFIILGVVLLLALAGCAAKTSAQANTGGNTANTPGAVTGGQFNNLQARMAVGTLSLEGTGLAISPDQAKQLLPLWQKVKSMETEGATTTPADLQAVYKQIETVMTADQIAQIQKMTLSQNQLQGLLTKYGVQITPGAGFNGGVQATPNADQLATRSARQTQNPNDGGGFGGGGNGNATLSPDQLATRTALRTLTPGAFPGGGRGNFAFSSQVFIDPLIKLLTEISGN